MAIDKSKEQRKGVAFIRGKEGSGRGCFEEFRVVMATHWLSVAVSHWLGCNQESKFEGNQLKGCR